MQDTEPLSSLDCHAEIVSRRCLCEFLYQQLEILVGGNQLQKDEEKEKHDSLSIFESRPDGKGYRLKVRILLLY